MCNKVQSQQTNDQLRREHNIQTQIVKDNKRGTYETYTNETKDRKLKSLMSVPYDINL